MSQDKDTLEVQDNDANQTLVRIIEHFMDEMQDLQNFIVEICKEVQTAQGSASGEDKTCPSVQDELEAVVKDSADATHAILDAVEKIQDIVNTLPRSYQTAFNSATVNIFEACTFQDLTGQRVRKVVKALGSVEDKVEKILIGFDKAHKKSLEIIQAHKNGDELPAPKKVEEQKDDIQLMNGPQLEQPTQDEIDALFGK